MIGTAVLFQAPEVGAQSSDDIAEQPSSPSDEGQYVGEVLVVEVACAKGDLELGVQLEQRSVRDHEIVGVAARRASGVALRDVGGD